MKFKQYTLMLAALLAASVASASPESALAIYKKNWKINAEEENRADPMLIKGMYGVPLKATASDQGRTTYDLFFNDRASLAISSQKWTKMVGGDPIPEQSRLPMYLNLLGNLDLSQAPITMTFGQGGPTYVLITAHDCPYARALVANLKRVEKQLNLTLAIFPVALQNKNNATAQALACSKNSKLWYDAMLGKPVQLSPADRNCTYSTGKAWALMDILSPGLNRQDKRGTPYIVAPNGQIETGPAQKDAPAKEVLQFFNYRPEYGALAGIGQAGEIQDGVPELIFSPAPWEASSSKKN